MKYLDKQTTAYTLAIYRILFGIVMSFFYLKMYLEGVVQWMFLDDRFHMHYSFMPNVYHLPANQLKVVFIVLIIASICFTIGFLYRWTSFICLVVLSYFMLLELSFYNNHYYLAILLYFLFFITDANKSFSVDSILFSKKQYYRTKIWQWQIDIFKFQIGVVYFYGGLSKLMNHDWLNNRVMSEIVASLLPNASQLKIQVVSNFMTYGGLLYDLGIVFLLIQKKLKWKLLGLAMVLSFNITNHVLLDIGIFPFIMLGATILFFDKQINLWIVKRRRNELNILPLLKRKSWGTKILIVYIAFQLLFPLRHLLIKGNVFYTGEGYYFSWHMMFGTIEGASSFRVVDNTNGVTYIINTLDYLTEKQHNTLISNPINAIQFANFIQDKVKLWGAKDMEIYGKIDIIRNGREVVPQINPEVNLLYEKMHLFKHNDWIYLNKFR